MLLYTLQAILTGANAFFYNIVGFTVFSQTLMPKQVVDVLDGLFGRFDELVQKRQLEKIKTVGDAYMVAAGIPIARADHAEAIAELASER